MNEEDPNNVEAYELSVHGDRGGLIRDSGEVAYGDLGINPIETECHAYSPLLHKTQNCEVDVRPIALNDNEKKVVESFAELARRGHPCLQGKELFLMRNQTGGRGISLFNDVAYYPDFLVWLKDTESQHLIFLDPKGLSRFGHTELKKVQMHHEIAEITRQVREAHPDLHLHAYILSVTAPHKIGAKPRSKGMWEEEGVYFLQDSDCLQRVIGDVLQSE